jgi:hypothetical protein
VFVFGGVTIRFGVELGLERIREPQLDMLAAVALALLDEEASARAPTMEVRPPARTAVRARTMRSCSDVVATARSPRSLPIAA